MSKNNTSQHKTTFWNFIKKQYIEIPIIQRDYAQGRSGKEELRDKFLKDLKRALDSAFPNEEYSLELDFVYGSIENNKLKPLDGQQRLTTLWLLHWYIAYKSQHLADEKEKFKKFTYETRISSRDFCCRLADFDTRDKEEIVSLIKNQTWFLSVWKQDPTINAMLNMLASIETIMKKCEDSQFNEYWTKLVDDNCAITFYYLDLDSLSLSDDLYIKMNARGKMFTHFENFKADLISYIRKNNIDKNKKIEDAIAHKLDTSWTDVFWKFRSPEHKIDEIYFAFINRFILNCIITAKQKSVDKYLRSQENLENEKLFEHIYKGAAREYNNFDIYSEEGYIEDALHRLEIVMDSFSTASKEMSKEDIKFLFFAVWDGDESNSYFIPEYEKNETGKFSLVSISQSQRVVFFAICRYFELKKYDKINLKQWMRVIWNIVENSDINSVETMIGAMRLIDELADALNHSLYETLADESFRIRSNYVKEQVEEERNKSKRIICYNYNSQGNTSIGENEIIEAEKQPFFKGNIAYLLESCKNDVGRYNEILTLCKERIVVDDTASLKSYLTHIAALSL